MLVFRDLQELDSLMLRSRLFQSFGNVIFGKFSKALSLGICIDSFTTLSDVIGLNICLNVGGSLSRKRHFINSAVRLFKVSSKFKIPKFPSNEIT